MADFADAAAGPGGPTLDGRRCAIEAAEVRRHIGLTGHAAEIAASRETRGTVGADGQEAAA